MNKEEMASAETNINTIALTEKMRGYSCSGSDFVPMMDVSTAYKVDSESMTAERAPEYDFIVKTGRKHDQDKPRYDLVPVHAEAEFVDVLTFGANKYGPENWRQLEGARERYVAAAMRHLAAYRMGETHDVESGKHHLAHAQCCMAFIVELDLEENK